MMENRDEMEPAIPENLTAEEVGNIFLAVEKKVTELRSTQGQKRLLKMGGLVTACTAIATAASVALASFGFKVIGPPAEIQAVSSRVTEVNAKVDTLGAQVATIIIDRERYRREQDVRWTALEADVKMTKYLTCVLVRRTDPTLVPADCTKP